MPNLGLNWVKAEASQTGRPWRRAALEARTQEASPATALGNMAHRSRALKPLAWGASGES